MLNDLGKNISFEKLITIMHEYDKVRRKMLRTIYEFFLKNFDISFKNSLALIAWSLSTRSTQELENSRLLLLSISTSIGHSQTNMWLNMMLRLA